MLVTLPHTSTTKRVLHHRKFNIKMSTLRVKYRAKQEKIFLKVYQDVRTSLYCEAIHNAAIQNCFYTMPASCSISAVLLHFSCPRFTSIHSKLWKSNQIMKSGAITLLQALNVFQYISVMQLPELQTIWYLALYIHKLQQIKTTVG